MPLVNRDVAWAVDDVRARAKPLALVLDYDMGRHRLQFATEKYREAFAALFYEFADNMCDDVLDAISDRVQTTGWTVPNAPETDPEAPARGGLEQALEESWTLNQGESRTGALWRRAFRDGDGFVIAQRPKDGRGRWHVQDGRLMCVRYSTDAPDEIEVMGKLWREGSRYRLTLFYQDRKERWATKGIGPNGGIPNAQAFKLLPAGDPALAGEESAALAYEDGLGMPAFHFPNGELSQYGRSLLQGVIPLQDAYNKAILDMLVAMEYNAYPQRWATGLEVARDPLTGAEVNPFQKGEGRLWRTASKEAKLGQFDPGDVEGFLSVQDRLQLSILRKGVMPAHGVTMRSQTGQAPTGVSLLVAEGRTIKLGLDRQRDWGQELRRMQAYVLNLGGERGVTADDVEPVWVPPQTRDMVALLEELRLKKDLGVPTEQLLKEAGYEPADVKQFLEAIEDAKLAEQRALGILSGGRPPTGRGAAGTLGSKLGLPGGPVPPAGGGASPATDG